MHPCADGCEVREHKLATPCANTCVCAGRSVFGKRLKVHRGCDGHFKPKHGECPGLIAEHGQAGVTPSSCVRNAAWLSGLAVCWPRRPPIVCVCAAWWHANAWLPTCVCADSIATLATPTPKLGSRGRIENCTSGNHTTTTLHGTSTNRTCSPHPMKPFSRIAMPCSHARGTPRGVRPL